MNGDLVQLTAGVRERLARLGANVAHATSAARLPASGALSTEQFFAFWEALAASSPNDVGLRLATETQVHEYDISSLAALHSPDLGTALSKTARYKRLCGPKAMDIETKGKEVTIHTTYLHAPGPTPPRLVDASLASLLVLIQRGSGLPLAPKRVELSRARSDEPMLLRFFGCPLRFRAERDALVLDERLLATPFVTHNADLLKLLLPSLDEKLAPMKDGSFVEQVRAVVARRMSGERPSVAKVARPQKPLAPSRKRSTHSAASTLVNNAGYANSDSAEDIALDDFRAQIDTNFYGVVHVTRAVLPIMRKQRHGRILQVSSIGGRRGGTPGLSAYQAAKFAVAGFSEVVHNEVAPLGIQLTIVEPGGFATDWAGSSMTVHPARPDYEGTVGATNQRLRGNPGAARGVPDKAAKALLELASMKTQPRRLLLGSDAYVLAKVTLQELGASDDAHRTLSASTDADGLPDFAETEVGRQMLALGRNGAAAAT